MPAGVSLMLARSKRAKGNKLERWCVAFFDGIGLSARKQPGSGVYSGFPHDVSLRLPDGECIIEAKSWKHGWRTGDGALGQADILCIKRDYGEPAFYLPARTMTRFARMLAELQDLRAREEAARKA